MGAGAGPGGGTVGSGVALQPLAQPGSASSSKLAWRGGGEEGAATPSQVPTSRDGSQLPAGGAVRLPGDSGTGRLRHAVYSPCHVVWGRSQAGHFNHRRETGPPRPVLPPGTLLPFHCPPDSLFLRTAHSGSKARVYQLALPLAKPCDPGQTLSPPAPWTPVKLTSCRAVGVTEGGVWMTGLDGALGTALLPQAAGCADDNTSRFAPDQPGFKTLS